MQRMSLIAAAFASVCRLGEYLKLPQINTSISNNVSYKKKKIKQYGKRHKSQKVRANRRKARKAS